MVRLGRPHTTRPIHLLPRVLLLLALVLILVLLRPLDVAVGAALVHADAVHVLPLRHDGRHHAVRHELPVLHHAPDNQVQRGVEVLGRLDQQLRRARLADGVPGRADDAACFPDHPLPAEDRIAKLLARRHVRVVVNQADVPVCRAVVAMPEAEDVPVVALPRIVCRLGPADGFARVVSPARVVQPGRVDVCEKFVKVLVHVEHNAADVDVPGCVGFEDDDGREAIPQHG